MRWLLAAWLPVGLLAVSSAAFGQAAFDGHVKVGVLNDQSSLYADATGQGSVIGAQLALEDYMKANPNSKLKVDIIFADHQNKPDIGANIARQWIERDGVDMLLDVPNSGVALAVNDITRQLNKVMVNGSAGTARLTGDHCSPNTVHWTFDNFALANGTGRAVVSTGGDSWFFITADYAFGHDLEAQTMAVVKQMGGKVLGSVRAPLNTPDFSSFLLQAQTSKAKVIGLANAGGDTSTRSNRLPSSVSSKPGNAWPDCWCSSPMSTRSGSTLHRARSSPRRSIGTRTTTPAPGPSDSSRRLAGGSIRP
jgi:branched-chain amino acid transport system substrate-binding protein